jgi:hypothetical protein
MDERLKAASDAGKIGGEKICEKYGTAHFRAIGKKGGDATKAAYATGNDYYERIGKLGGKKGGKSTSAKHGPAFYQGVNPTFVSPAAIWMAVLVPEPTSRGYCPLQ